MIKNELSKNVEIVKDKIKYMKSYRTLAINRGEKEGILSVSLDYNKDEIIDFLAGELDVEGNVEFAKLFVSVVTPVSNASAAFSGILETLCEI